MPKAYLGLGSNKGDRLQYINRAIVEISALKDTAVTVVSSVYETEPWGVREQNHFLNCVVEIDTGLEAVDLATKLKVIERVVGRINSSKWYEREIDIDLLFYSDAIINTESLRIPHAEIEYRNFVIIPLAEIAPGLVHPVSGKEISSILSESKDSLEVKRIGSFILKAGIFSMAQE